jgi:hypothetical protein
LRSGGGFYKIPVRHLREVAALSTVSAIMRVPIYREDGSISEYAIVDADAFDAMMESRWNCLHGYAVTTRSGKQVGMHRLVTGVNDPAVHVHHRNGIKMDNRRCNLELVTRKEHHRRHAKGKAMSRGVRYDAERDCFVARPYVNGRAVFLGRFDSADEASAYIAEWMEQNGIDY